MFKQTLIDRAIAFVAPVHAVDRQRARAQLGVLAGLSDMGAQLGAGNAPAAIGGRRRSSAPRDARTDTLPYLRLERGASRELSRTSPIAVGAVQTNIDRVVGTGLALSAQPNSAVLGWSVDQVLAWKRQVHNEFSLWADSPESDIEQTLNFYQQQALILRAVLESGDCATMLPDGEATATQPYTLRLQVLEADRIGNPGNTSDTPTIAGGVKIDASGAPVAFHVYTSHPGGILPGQGGKPFEGTWIERVGKTGRRRILHHYRKLRPGMPRGVPYLAPIIECIKQISRYTEAEIMAAVVTAYFTVFVESPAASAAPVFGAEEDAGGIDNPIEMGPAAVVGLAPGEKITTANPMRPNPNFEPFTQAVIKQMGMALGLPYELLVKQFNASYSASKAALLDAGVYFRSVRTWLALSFCQPVYETWLAEAVARGRIAAPGFFTDPLMRWAYTRAAWPGDSMGSINPKDEVKAYVDAVDARLMTRERAEWELFGSDFNDTFDAKKSEQDRLKAADLLPAPKAGAAAPGAAPGAKPAVDQADDDQADDANQQGNKP
jgi:lambda family phage portal protein